MNIKNVKHHRMSQINISYLLFALCGLLCSGGSVIALPFAGRNIAVVTFLYYIIIAYQLAKNKFAIRMSSEKKCFAFLYFYMIINAAVAALRYNDVLSKEALFLTIKISTIAIGLCLIMEHNKTAKYLGIFKKMFYINCIIQMVWSWFERILYTFWNIKINEIVFGKLFMIKSTHALTFIKNGMIRPSGFSWEPANLSLVLIIGYIISKKKWVKILFAVSLLLTTSMTGFFLLAVVFIVECIQQKKITKKAIIGWGSGLVIFIVGLIYFDSRTGLVEYFISRFYGILFSSARDSSSHVHMSYYLNSFLILLRENNPFHLIFGRGTYRAGYFYSYYGYMYSYFIDRFWNPESDFVTLFVGNGLIGAILYYGFLLHLINKKRKQKKHTDMLIAIAILVGGITYIYCLSTWSTVILILICGRGTFESDLIQNNVIKRTGSFQRLQLDLMHN